ncbi:MAG TPA: hypothetical protein VGN48_13875 [Pedococcus sp.]|nr:hypothetical protein [Pedococcus sp.]
MRLAGGTKGTSLIALAVGIATIACGVAWAVPGNLAATCAPQPSARLDARGAVPSAFCPTPRPAATTVPPAAAGQPTTPAAPSPTPSSTAGVALGPRPTPTGTGVPPGAVLRAWNRPLTFTVDNVTLSGIDFHGMPKITGSNITITDCRFTSFAFYGPGPLTMRNCDGSGNLNVDAYYRDIDGILLDGVNLDVGSHDGFDLFSSAQGRISNVTVVNSIVHGMDFPPESRAHGDAMQVRGVTHLRVLNTVLDDGPYQHQKNSAFYLENVHGGLNDILIADSWLSGGGYTFYSNFVNPGMARHVHIALVGHWGLRRTKGGWTFVDVTGPTGEPVYP